MNMNYLVIYFSKFGNTHAVAETIAESLASGGTGRVMSSDRLTADDLKEPDLVVMGSPTHRMNLPEAVRPVLEALPRRVLKGKRVVAFDTSYKMSAWLARFTAAKKLDRKLRKRGGNQLLPPETFFVVDREGPLYDGEIERAREWASAILARAVETPKLGVN